MCDVSIKLKLSIFKRELVCMQLVVFFNLVST